MKWLNAALQPRIAALVALLVLLPIQLTTACLSEGLTAPPKSIGDGPEYENIAYHLWQGEGYRSDNRDRDWRKIYETAAQESDAQLTAPPRSMLSTGRPPLLPTLIAGCYRVFGRNATGFAAVRCSLALCLALAGALAVHNACWFFHQAQQFRRPHLLLATCVAAFATTAFMGLNRTLQDYATDFLTEPLAILLIQVFVLCLLLSTKPSSTAKMGWLIAGGMSLGLAILARSIFVAWLPGLWLLLALTLGDSWRQRTFQASLVVLSAVVICLPWWVRNSVVLQAWAPLGTQGPITLLGGYSDPALRAAGEWQLEPERQLRAELAADPRLVKTTDDTQRELITSRVAGRRVRQWISEHLDDLPSMFLGRIVTHWNPYFGRALIWKGLAFIGVLAVLAALAQQLRRPSTDDYNVLGLALFTALFLGLPLLSTLVTALLYSVGGRFLVPMYGIISTLAGIGLACTTVQILALVKGIAEKTDDSGSKRELFNEA